MFPRSQQNPQNGGGFLDEFTQPIVTHHSGEWEHLVLRVSALEKMMTLQQQNNAMMIRLVNALSPVNSYQPPPPPPRNPQQKPETVPECELESEPVLERDDLADLKQRGVRRAAF